MRYISVLMIFLSISVFGQRSMAPPSGGGGGGGIKGKVVDSSSEAPIEFSSVSVFKSGEKKPVAIESTAADGSFNLRGIPKGEYTLKVSFVGYASNKFDSIQVSGFAPVDLGTIKLAINSTELDAVVVKGEKSLIESKIDRKVFNVDKSIVAQSGTAADVLQQVPSVSVDVDGKVSLRGSENVNILINGRPSMIDVATLLAQIPANSIDKVETITNPSVKFDSEGTSGIINIVLKQGVAQGFNGTAAVNVGTNDKYNGSLNLNYNPGKYNLFGAYSFRKEHNDNTGETMKDLFLKDSIEHVGTIGTRDRQSHMVRLGIDYFLTSQLTAGVNGSVNIGKNHDKDSSDHKNFFDSMNNANLSDLWFRNSTEVEDNVSYDYAAYITNKFNNEGHEIRFDYSYGNGDETQTQDYNQNSVSNYLNMTLPMIKSRFSIEKDTTKSKRSNHIISTDYTYPINEKMKLELGGKINIRNNSDELYATKMDTAGKMVNDVLRTSNLDYHEDINSVYGTFSLTQGKFSVMAGVKEEIANYNTKLVLQNQTFNNQFFSFIPSLHMVEKLNETNEINLSYSRRINRPRGHMLNPLPEYDDPMNIRIGNPNLKPEYTNSFEAGYTFKPEKLTIQPTMFYRIVEDRFAPYRTTDSATNVSTTVFQNLALSHSYGFDLAVTYQPFRAWNINMSGSLFQYAIDATSSSPEKQKFSYNGKIMSNHMFPMGFTVQLSAFYRSPFITTQGESDPFYSFNMGAKKDLLKGKLVASFTYNDIFNTMRFAMNSRTNADYAEMWRKRESSIIFVGLTYKFGKMPKNGKKPQKNNGQDENGGDDMMY